MCTSSNVRLIPYVCLTQCVPYPMCALCHMCASPNVCLNQCAPHPICVPHPMCTPPNVCLTQCVPYPTCVPPPFASLVTIFQLRFNNHFVHQGNVHKSIQVQQSFSSLRVCHCLYLPDDNHVEVKTCRRDVSDVIIYY